MTDSALEQAAAWLRSADGLLITAGAGMGIDSGLPDFRGPGGFWSVYPALGRARIAFESIANPAAFECDPQQAWGFYGHRLDLYRHATPHPGFRMLLEMAQGMQHGIRVFTSNVDGQFQKAGFAADRICEIHGSIHHLQCTAGCGEHIWSADEFQPAVDAENCRLLGEQPHCPHCGALARPNILMFNDWGWLERRTTLQYQRLQQWLATVERLVCIEIGAGTNIPTVRHFSEDCGGKLIRINPGEPEVPNPATGISLKLGGLAGISLLSQAL
ncbi:SIR2 family NAD-dependent protein deacylase [Ferribacterium limneticum]|uniref:SIR2 family NAD-dependent protein deacylase n=1 Tax=Ferribacterium limneticum TaxID=76259 RepID=UPI001CF95FBD|nr:Sir2 family NAD-dependent protein deacetylase [Ferribacterium limneticum]UCV28546.1 NAD-dependent deacetylase [Ferribacterium limneticum]UCV32463.1 NAD-dependent deacetylase [Ferribacterium limneticum]